MTSKPNGSRPGRREGCPLCGSSNVVVRETIRFQDLRRLYLEAAKIDIQDCLHQRYEGDWFELSRCWNCGLEYYPKELEGNHTLYEHLGKNDYYYMSDKWEFREAMRWIPEKGAVLEVGCGFGSFLEGVKHAYPHTTLVGLESTPQAAAVARSKGLDVRTQSLDDLLAEPQRYDVVCAFQVLEHLSNPVSFLASIFACLRKDGRCVITVPNPEGFTKFVVNDFGNMPPHHLSKWSANVFRWVAARYGLELSVLSAEPVAGYHRAWYRQTYFMRWVSQFLGIQWKRIELGLSYKALNRLIREADKMLPTFLWRYDRTPGHTLLAVFHIK
jgi:SAM-dependent methyltransferase